MPDNPVYLYVQTEPNVYTIFFDGNWSTAWSMDSMKMFYGETKNLLPNGFVKNWFIFKWWSTGELWVVEYLDQGEVTNLTWMDSWVVILYAQRLDIRVPFVIEYYQENVAWTWYDLVGTGSGYGPMWPYIITTWQMYTWFTLQTWAEVSISSGWTVPYYYTRNTYDLTVNDRGQSILHTWVKYWADIPLPADPEWTWNTFEWWDDLPGDGKMPADDLVITSTWSYGVHTITFDTDWWTEIPPITKNYWELIDVPANPTKSWYNFVWWEPALPDVMPYDDITVKAIWREIWSWKWWSGRWRRWWISGISEWESHWAPDSPQTWDQNVREDIDLEVFFAYMWAHDMWILETWWEYSDPDGYVTRWDMAEMLVKFTENVLELEIPENIPENCAWWDSDEEWKTPQTKAYAEKTCALWVMWIRMKDFMPNKILDRAEFGTILSRLLWWDKYDVVDATKTNLYYVRHLQALKDRKIMTQIEDPESQFELRKWAWLMLMRARIEKAAILEEQASK